MENKKDQTEAQDKQQPQPTDNVQLEIETVVPSTHENKVKAGQPETKQTTEKPADESEKEQETQDEQNDENTSESGNIDEGTKSTEDDKGDDIETITPSA